jgi:predicted PurR-regulated permease PerM
MKELFKNILCCMIVLISFLAGFVIIAFVIITTGTYIPKLIQYENPKKPLSENQKFENIINRIIFNDSTTLTSQDKAKIIEVLYKYRRKNNESKKS